MNDMIEFHKVMLKELAVYYRENMGHHTRVDECRTEKGPMCTFAVYDQHQKELYSQQADLCLRCHLKLAIRHEYCLSQALNISQRTCRNQRK